MMNPVIQEDRTGCGLAAVATIVGASYQQIKKVAVKRGITVNDPRLWSDREYVCSLLTHYGFTTSPQTTPFHSWENLPPLALLAIKWHQKQEQDFWHWVVSYRNPKEPVVFDPKRELRTNRRTDFGRMQPKWLMTVTPKNSQ